MLKHSGPQCVAQSKWCKIVSINCPAGCTVRGGRWVGVKMANVLKTLRAPILGLQARVAVAGMGEGESIHDPASECVPWLACACERASSLLAMVQGSGHNTLGVSELLSCSHTHSPRTVPVQSPYSPRTVPVTVPVMNL